MVTEAAKDIHDAAMGCLLGACVGDAAGATLEFLGRVPSLQEVQQAMRMPGGGVWNVAPGQITDDCELGLSLALALADHTDFNLEAIAQRYADWIRSSPFDIGQTTRQSLGCFRESGWRDLCEQQGYAVAMTQVAQQRSMSSKANGSLMRISPLGVWGHRHSDEQLAEMARSDSGLSHPHPNCKDAVACYTIAIASLMQHLGDNRHAFQRAHQWASQYACEEVRSWMDDALHLQKIPFQPYDGFVKIAFVHAFRHLWLATPFTDAIEETLRGGGDTDTNACIVGGLLGALWGEGQIPITMKEPVLRCDTTQGNPRPDFLHPSQIPSMVARFLRTET